MTHARTLQFLFFCPLFFCPLFVTDTTATEQKNGGQKNKGQKDDETKIEQDEREWLVDRLSNPIESTPRYLSLGQRRRSWLLFQGEVQMVRQAGFGVCLAVAVFIGLAGTAFAADLIPSPNLDRNLATLRAVESEGRGNKEALVAWKELALGVPQDLPAIFLAFDGANPLAVNYLRSLVETIWQRELEKGAKLPLAAIEKFVLETSHDPQGRRLAYEVLAQVDSTAADRLIPGMINDPSVEFRRDAVARLIDDAEKLLKAEKRDDARRTLGKALVAARDDDQVQVLKKQLEGLGEKVDLPGHFGFLMSWRLVAPFDNVDKKGLAAVYPPERELDLAVTYDGKEGQKIGWVAHTTDNEYGVVDLAKALGPFKGSVAYATTEFQSAAERQVEFRLGTPNSWKVWLNGDPVFAREEYHRGMNLDQYRMRGKLRSGKNVILIKICQNEQTEEWAQRWQFQLRVCDATGTAVLSTDRAGKSDSASRVGLMSGQAFQPHQRYASERHCGENRRPR